MELVYFSNQTLPKALGNGRQKVPRISFGKSGVISLNQHAVDLIGLKDNGKLSLAQDQKEPENWYIFIDTNGFEVRAGYKDNGVIFNHKDLVKSFLEVFEKDVKVSHSFLIAKEPTTMKGSKTQYWGILVK